jgi:small GTP-binding protein
MKPGLAEYDLLVKTVIIGDAGVGKSDLVNALCGVAFVDHIYDCTIGVDFRIYTRQAHGKIIKYQGWDTAGEERFRCTTNRCCRGAQLILFVFDASSQMSLANLSRWLKDAREYNSEAYRFVLVAQKSD